MLTICFTGHRPDKLYGYDWDTEGNQKLMGKLKNVIIQTLMEEWDVSTNKEVKLIFGGALGIDQMSFDVCCEIRDIYDGYYELEIAVPFNGQERRWFNKKDVDRYRWQISEANKVVIVDTLDKYAIKGFAEGEYHPAKMQKRNEYMVDNSDIVIAVWNGSKGGTANCVNYAKRKGKKIITINPKDI